MRKRRDGQLTFDFQRSTLATTNAYFERYAAIDRILNDTPKILELVHADLVAAFDREEKQRDRECTYTSENVLRVLLCQVIEGMALREIVTRIDDSNFLRRFVRIDDGPMMNFTTLDSFKNAIRPETMKKANAALAKHAVGAELITSYSLRLDTTAIETNIHYPTDSSLLWDLYRVLGRFIDEARKIDPKSVGDKRLQTRRAKKLHVWLARNTGKKGQHSPEVKERYKPLIELVEGVLAWLEEVAEKLRRRLTQKKFAALEDKIQKLIEDIEHYSGFVPQVAHQSRTRVLEEKTVPAKDKLYSIFEEHTELLIRGKAGKKNEFGHMILIQQCEEKFITDYSIFANRPVDSTLVDPALKSHKKLFGEYPSLFTGDKGFYESMEKIKELEERIDVVGIAKMGSRNAEEEKRETNWFFRFAQRFRAGVEGSISYLKRAFRLFRCFNKGWDHYQVTVGSAILAHNLLLLASGGG